MQKVIRIFIREHLFFAVELITYVNGEEVFGNRIIDVKKVQIALLYFFKALPVVAQNDFFVVFHEIIIDEKRSFVNGNQNYSITCESFSIVFCFGYRYNEHVT